MVASPPASVPVVVNSRVEPVALKTWTVAAVTPARPLRSVTATRTWGLRLSVVAGAVSVTAGGVNSTVTR